MFKIYDGRESFYQWDLQQKLIVANPTIKEVHFCNRTEECALICKTYEFEGQLVADVPNILLQNDWRIRVYAYDGQATLHEARFDVIKRSKPDLYVYTETEIYNYEDIVNRMENIETTIEENVAEYLETYLEENPIASKVISVNGKDGDVVLTAEDVGATTQEYVDSAISQIELMPGQPGKDGAPGKDGKDGEDGVDGKNGVDGISATHTWNGTVLTITSASGTSSANLQGQAGKDGKNGVDGEDYILTEADKSEIANIVIGLIPIAEEASY